MLAGAFASVFGVGAVSGIFGGDALVPSAFTLPGALAPPAGLALGVEVAGGVVGGAVAPGVAAPVPAAGAWATVIT